MNTNNQRCTILDLPTELQSSILEFLPCSTLGSCRAVSKQLQAVVDSPYIWRSALKRDLQQWSTLFNIQMSEKIKSAGSETSETKTVLKMLYESVIYKKISSQISLYLKTSVETPESKAVNWKEIYKLHHLQNTHKLPQTLPVATSKVKDVKLRIPIFGEGLDNDPICLYSTLMWSKSFSQLGLFPGIEGLGSGVAFEVNSTPVCISAMYKTEDRSMFDKAKPLWREFFKNADSFLFVVDLTNMELSKTEMNFFFQNEWINSSKPVLIVACIPDKEEGTSKEEIANVSAKVVDELGLYDNELMKNRVWAVTSVTTGSMDTFWSSVVWLVEQSLHQ